MGAEDRYERLDGTFLDRHVLRETLVVVGGAGALGNEIVKNLSMLGVGRILIADFDTIELHNVTRSVLLCIGDLEAAMAHGTPKAEFVAASARHLNPDVRAVPYVGDIASLGVGVFQRANLVFSAFDNMRARYLLQMRAAEAGKVMVDGGLGNDAKDVLAGEVTMYDAGRGPCYGCRLTPATREALTADLLGGGPDGCGARAVQIEAAGGAPSTPMMASVVAATQVVQGLKYLMDARGFQAPPGVAARFDLSARPKLDSLRLRRHPACPLHGYRPRPADVQLPGRSDRTTLDELWRAAAEQLGGETVLQLPLALVSAIGCTSCGHQEQRWQALVNATREPCPACGSRARESADVPTYAYAPDSEVDGRDTVRDLGFPWLEAYEALRHDEDGSVATRRVELVGDLEALGLTH